MKFAISDRVAMYNQTKIAFNICSVLVQELHFIRSSTGDTFLVNTVCIHQIIYVNCVGITVEKLKYG